MNVLLKVLHPNPSDYISRHSKVGDVVIIADRDMDAHLFSECKGFIKLYSDITRLYGFSKNVDTIWLYRHEYYENTGALRHLDWRISMTDKTKVVSVIWAE